MVPVVHFLVMGEALPELVGEMDGPEPGSRWAIILAKRHAKAYKSISDLTANGDVANKTLLPAQKSVLTQQMDLMFLTRLVYAFLGTHLVQAVCGYPCQSQRQRGCSWTSMSISPKEPMTQAVSLKRTTRSLLGPDGSHFGPRKSFS
jgi:hypothetical protein